MAIIFFSIPALLLVLFLISLSSYISAKEQNKAAPGTFTDNEIKNRKIALIVLSVITAVPVAVVIGFIILLSFAVSFM